MQRGELRNRPVGEAPRATSGSPDARLGSLVGPAQKRPYHPAYVPAAWRGWVPFGNGTVGDWTCHVVDPVFWALDLGAPKTIAAQVKDYDFRTQSDAYPKGEIITFEFAAKNKRPPVILRWHTGSERIPRPPEFETGDTAIDTGAAVFGDKGTIIYGSHGASKVRLIPEVKMDAYKRPAKTIPRVKDHHGDWLQAIRNGTRRVPIFPIVSRSQKSRCWESSQSSWPARNSNGMRSGCASPTPEKPISSSIRPVGRVGLCEVAAQDGGSAVAQSQNP